MTRFAGIIGHPVAHSLSPSFQSAAFAYCGLDVRYELWDTTAAELPARALKLRSPDCLGANVTIPHKEAVIPLIDELGDQSARVGAVNTIVNRGGRLFGFNTDGPGFVDALRGEARFDPAGASFLLLGAGGAARGIAFALAEAQVSRIGIANRTPDRARRLAEDVAATGVVAGVVAPGDSLATYDCVVNCTSLGMEGGPGDAVLPCDTSLLRPGALVVDIVYVPEETTFLGRARDTGHPTLGGLPMLVYQGARAFQLWTGIPAPIEVMFNAARAALAQRSRAQRP